MNNSTLLQDEFKENRIPKYIQDIIVNHLCLSKGETPNTFLLYNSKHATSETIHWRYEKLKKWIINNGGVFREEVYNWDKEFCGAKDKFYEVQFFFPSFNAFKSMFAYVGYYQP